MRTRQKLPFPDTSLVSPKLGQAEIMAKYTPSSAILYGYASMYQTHGYIYK